MYVVLCAEGGLFKEDDAGQPRIKLYKDDKGHLKGDGTPRAQPSLPSLLLCLARRLVSAVLSVCDAGGVVRFGQLRARRVGAAGDHAVGRH